MDGDGGGIGRREGRGKDRGKVRRKLKDWDKGKREGSPTKCRSNKRRMDKMSNDKTSNGTQCRMPKCRMRQNVEQAKYRMGQNDKGRFLLLNFREFMICVHKFFSNRFFFFFLQKIISF
jgi:hypothetical protein